MGALAPVFHWIPEDDLLLKNAVESGASLESLAKGAVQFSRRFTVHELQNRWFSLLYDSVVSAEASACMIEFERSTPYLPSKSNRFENAKESKYVSGKRKAESVRNCYYSMRKRICNEPFDSMDLNILVGPGHNNCFGNGDEPPPANCMLGDPTSNHFGQQDSNLVVTRCAFPEFGTGSTGAANVGVTADAFYTGFHNPVEEDLYMAQNNMHERIAHTFGENGPLATSFSGVKEWGQPKEVPVSNLFEAPDLDAKPSIIADQNIGNRGNVCSGFEGSQVFNSPTSDCGASLPNLGYTSLLPPVPIWRKIEGISASTVPDVHWSGNEQDMRDAFACPEDGSMENTNTSGYDIVHLDSKQKNQMPSDITKNSTPTPNDYLAELSNTLLNFTNEEELFFMNADGKDGIDKSYIDGFSSLLLDSPNRDMPNIAANEAAVASDNYLAIAGGEYCGESDDKGQSCCGDGHAVFSSESQILPCASAVNPQFPELCNGAVSCMLNTEDTEIPSNDDAFLPNEMPSSSLSSVTQLKLHEANNPALSYVMGFSDHQKANAGCLSLMKREQKNPEQSHLSPQMRGSQLVPETGLSHLVGDRGAKFELPNNERPHVAFRVASTACQGPSKISAAKVSTTPLLPSTPKDEATDIEQAKHLNFNTDSYLEKPAPGFDNLGSYPQGNAISCKQEVDAPATIQNQQALHAKLRSVETSVPELVVNHSTANQEELPSESDGDVPHFSDVEAMILGMDLSPDDPDLCSNREVSRYQQENSKRAIIRLEQAAHSCMQRVMASQGALAVLYGRHSKFYIKKPEVLLGRATEDFVTDIDLGREGHANKISRRQAIIKMDQSGSFYLKNLGKVSIFVNNKKIAPQQNVSLTSSCLIEVRGMPFIFETNQTRVKQYADSVTKEGQTQDRKV